MVRVIVVLAVVAILVIPMGMGTMVVERAAPISSPIEPSGKLQELRIAVTPSLPFGELTMDYLKRTELFGEVIAGKDDSADLTFHVRETRDTFLCGNPYMVTLFTLGLVPLRERLPFRMDMTVRGGDTEIAFQAETTLRSVTGLQALFLLPSRSWSSWDSGDRQEDFAAFLRERLLEREAELVALASRE